MSARTWLLHNISEADILPLNYEVQLAPTLEELSLFPPLTYGREHKSEEQAVGQDAFNNQ